MYELQILFQRRRKIIARLAIAALLGTAATLAVLPRADAGVATVTISSVSLLSPARLASRQFSEFYPLSH
jgi:hypothetical protein